MDLTPWQLFVDLGLVAMLLLVGKLVRVRVAFVQRLFLPASVIGGGLGLALGSQGADWLPASDAWSTYPGILIGLVFAALPFASEHVPLRTVTQRLTSLWGYSSVAILLQWAVGITLVALVLRPLWPDLNPGFGALIAAGFVGGHGTAAAIGEAFAELGWPEAGSLAMTSATVGILSAILGGMLWVRWGASSGQARYVTRFEDLPPSLRTGLVAEGEREPAGEETVASGSIDTLVFHFSLICAAATIGYFLSRWSAAQFPQFRLPVFCGAFLVATALRWLLGATGGLRFVDPRTMAHLSGACTDLLVVFGIASIRISVLVEYAMPMALLMLAGIALSCALLYGLGPHFFRSHWFERSLFTWGWTTGVTAMGIVLLRIVDPRNRSATLADFGLAYLFIAPLEIGILTAAPQLLVAGHGLPLAGAALCGALAFMVVTLWRPSDD